MDKLEGKIDQAVDDWFHRYIHNSVISRHESTYNYMYVIKENLKKMLKEAIADETI